MTKKNKKPSVLLVGVGRFGVHHLRAWKKLHDQGSVKLIGAVARKEKVRQVITSQYGVPAFTDLTDSLLRETDALDIVTPADTHYELVKKYLPKVHIFVEKPMAFRKKDVRRLYAIARKHKRALVAGHIYRFHPVTERLLKVLTQKKLSNIVSISGEFISPRSTYRQGQEASFEELHLFDVLDLIFKKEPFAAWSKGSPSLIRTELRYAPAIDAKLKIGWEGKDKKRFLSFDLFSNGRKENITADYVACTIAYGSERSKRVEVIKIKNEPLEMELRDFVHRIRGEASTGVDQKRIERVISVAERTRPTPGRKPSVAIIGAGIFGATAASVLGNHFEVTLLERGDTILGGASWANQYRHHQGYHYPRSIETIEEIRAATKDFEEYYRGIIDRRFPSYYCVSKHDSFISAKRFMSVCKKMKLPCAEKYPPKEFLDRRTVSLSVLSNEAIYDYDKLRSITQQKIKTNQKIKLHLRCDVVSVQLLASGVKKIIWRNTKSGKNSGGSFDYVINASYADYNTFCRWLKFPQKNLSYRFKELLVLDIESKDTCAVTIMDGPFATLVPTSIPHRYTFGDVPLSIHKKQNTYNHVAFEKWKRNVKSRSKRMLKRCSKWMPILNNARYIKSVYAALPVENTSQSNDARPTDITPHGFGCYSIFSGKIITSVSAVYKLDRDLHQDAH